VVSVNPALASASVGVGAVCAVAQLAAH